MPKIPASDPTQPGTVALTGHCIGSSRLPNDAFRSTQCFSLPESRGEATISRGQALAHRCSLLVMCGKPLFSTLPRGS